MPIEDKIVVQMSLEKMDELKKEVIKLICHEGLTQQATAKQHGISQRMISCRLNMGLKEMHTYMV